MFAAYTTLVTLLIADSGVRLRSRSAGCSRYATFVVTLIYVTIPFTLRCRFYSLTFYTLFYVYVAGGVPVWIVVTQLDCLRLRSDTFELRLPTTFVTARCSVIYTLLLMIYPVRYVAYTRFITGSFTFVPLPHVRFRSPFVVDFLLEYRFIYSTYVALSFYDSPHSFTLVCYTVTFSFARWTWSAVCSFVVTQLPLPFPHYIHILPCHTLPTLVLTHHCALLHHTAAPFSRLPARTTFTLPTLTCFVYVLCLLPLRVRYLLLLNQSSF